MLDGYIGTTTMSKRISLCFDGTWNTPSYRSDLTIGRSDASFEKVDPAAGIETNVCRLYRSIEATRQPSPGEAGCAQIKWYDPGVGTRWYDRVAGGAFGFGLGRNIREGYKFLSDTYDDGDEVFIFGFSRGAYTARSLVGMIRNCGLLPRGTLKEARADDNDLLLEAYQLYQSRDCGPRSIQATDFRNDHRSRIIEIRFLGVWDTVGALGIPIESFEDFNRQQFEFHDTELSSIVKNAFHAIAIDEHREAYAPTLWAPKQRPEQVVEQRWFVGSHTDIGGGYADRGLSDVTLNWMQGKAQGLGLRLDPAGVPKVDEHNLTAPVADSFGNFLGGLFRLFSERHYRPIGSSEFGNETIDDGVVARMRMDVAYQPRNPGLEKRTRWPAALKSRSRGNEQSAVVSVSAVS
jgi:uncharacterized protein (DUF2235 family)